MLIVAPTQPLVWGRITGSLIDQTDLAMALAALAPATHDHAGVYLPSGSNINLAGYTLDTSTNTYTATLGNGFAGGYFTGSGAIVSLCNAAYALDVTGSANITGNLACNTLSVAQGVDATKLGGQDPSYYAPAKDTNVDITFVSSVVIVEGSPPVLQTRKRTANVRLLNGELSVTVSDEFGGDVIEEVSDV